MTEFIKTNTGLSEVGRSKIRNYDSVECVNAAIASGELKECDLFTTVAAQGITEDIQAVINCLVSITPANASCENMLVTQTDLTGAGGINDQINCVACCIADVAADVVCKVYCNDFNQLASRVGVNETNICSLQCDKLDKSVFNSFYNNEYTSLANDYNSQIACRVQCCDYEAYQATVCTALTDIDNEYLALESRVTTAEGNVSNLQSCPGLDCTGTVVASDIANLTSCRGTVTQLWNTANNTACTPDVNGSVAVHIPTFSLSGTVLTITV